MTDTLFITTGTPSAVKYDKAAPGMVLLPVPPRAPMGRPTVMTPEVLRKLEDAFMHAFSDREACIYAGISTSTLYDYCLDHPDFSERKEALKMHPNLAAKRELVVGIKGSTEQARWWATHKMGDEFAPKSKVEHSGGVVNAHVALNPEAARVVGEFNEKFREAIAAPHKGPKKT